MRIEKKKEMKGRGKGERRKEKAN
jgi:hypothetical protein